MYLTTDEFLELKSLKEKEYQYITRDLDNSLIAWTKFPEKLFKRFNEWIANGNCICLDESLFEFINWEDEEPYKIEKMLNS